MYLDAILLAGCMDVDGRGMTGQQGGNMVRRLMHG
jgi:hypothetical protein